MLTPPNRPSRSLVLRSEDAKEGTMMDIRHPGAAPDDIEKDFDVAVLVRTRSRGTDARFGLRAILPPGPVPRCATASGACLAMEMTLSRKRAQSQTRGRKLHRTERRRGLPAFARPAPLSNRHLKHAAGDRQHAGAPFEATKQQTATSEMLRIISNSPIQSVLDAVAENAARLCDADNTRSCAWRTTFFGW